MNIHKLKSMIAEPASKEWFEKHGSPKHKALHKARRLTPAEQKEKTKNWPKAEKGRDYGMKAQMGRTEENREFQRRTGRAWND